MFEKSNFPNLFATRRKVVFGAGASLGLSMLARPVAAQSGELVIANWGGDWNDRCMRFIETPLVESKGVKIVRALNLEPERKTKLLAERNLPRGTLSLAQFTAGDAHELNEQGIVEPIDYSKIPNAVNIRPSLRSPYFVPFIVGGLTLAYNPKYIKSPPTSFAELWNPEYAGKLGVLTGGASFKPLTLNAADAQLLEVRRFGVEEIARIFRVPISLLGHPVAGAMSFASVEAQNLSFVQHSLRPLLERLEQALSPLLPEADGFIKFNLDALLRGTTLERYEAYTKGLNEGFLSLNDVRAVEDLSPLGEAGDQYRVPLQNIDASDAKDVGLKLRTEIATNLIQVGFEPKSVLEAVGLPAMDHTGVPTGQLQQVSTIDPEDPLAVYEVK